MAIVQNLAFLVLLALAWVSISINAVSSEDDLMKCGSTVRMWAASSLEVQDKDKHTLQDLLFFLHIPRTAGRTYFHWQVPSKLSTNIISPAITHGFFFCNSFLRKLYAGYLECPRSYDKFRFDPSKSDCRLMVTHDDYSVMSRLPQERTSVVTIQRNPVDRVFSTYEFSVEVAARFLVHPNLTSATEMMKRILPKNSGVSTLNIWPWKFLVPWMREDLFARRDARKHGVFEDESSDLYNMANFVMPLHEFVNDPIAHDIIHNGATFQCNLIKCCTVHVVHASRTGCFRRLSKKAQRNTKTGSVPPIRKSKLEAKEEVSGKQNVLGCPGMGEKGLRAGQQNVTLDSENMVAGLTNNSLSKYSSEVRRCVRKHPSLGKFVLKVAKKRLDNMLYVGITENHKESATMFANMVGAQVLSQLQALNSSFKKSVEKPTGIQKKSLGRKGESHAGHKRHWMWHANRQRQGHTTLAVSACWHGEYQFKSHCLVVFHRQRRIRPTSPVTQTIGTYPPAYAVMVTTEVKPTECPSRRAVVIGDPEGILIRSQREERILLGTSPLVKPVGEADALLENNPSLDQVKPPNLGPLFQNLSLVYTYRPDVRIVITTTMACVGLTKITVTLSRDNARRTKFCNLIISVIDGDKLRLFDVSLEEVINLPFVDLFWDEFEDRPRQNFNQYFGHLDEVKSVSTSFPDTEHDNNHLQNSTSNQMTNDFSPTGNVGTRNGTMTVGNLMEDYEVCISSLRKTQTRRRASSLKRISSANFSKEARLQVSKMVIQKIRSLNSLDLELYKHAQDIFVQQRKHLTERLVEAERQKVILDNSYEVTLWNVVFVVSVMLLLLILAFLLVNRSSSKLKV
ncbi:hypothetical protein GIB67_027630 [Kingdonia uniflora]|uniref:Sulfotransferase n=1 Tax=Kingdonia uniflora TaxID=39325 RepID=A0A7J7NLL0_9MAGN|nr:hypothetical protein GIB67_027630 [Kingdonia uniflora]